MKHARDVATANAVPLDNASIEQLILAAGGRDEALREVAEALGTARVCSLAMDEIAFRADVPIVDLVDGPVHVQLDVVAGQERISHVFAVSHGRPLQAEPGTSSQAAQLVEYQLTDLVRELFGPARPRSAGGRRTVPRFEAAAAAHRELTIMGVTRASHQATAAVLSGIDKRAADLDALAPRYHSDKWGGLHWFTPHYERHLGPLRDEPVRVLEIGVGGYSNTAAGGGSLRMWRRFFPRGLVYGLDIFDKSCVDQPRVQTLIGSQNDPDRLIDLAADHGPFDVVIDDGSHVNEHVLTSFRMLFPHLRSGGVYVIEDLWTAYCPGYGGEDSPEAGRATSIGAIKSLVDAIHHEERPSNGRSEPSYVEANLVGLHVYHNIAFLEKGINAEGAIPAWVPRMPPAS